MLVVPLQADGSRSALGNADLQHSPVREERRVVLALIDVDRFHESGGVRFGLEGRDVPVSVQDEDCRPQAKSDRRSKSPASTWAAWAMHGRLRGRLLGPSLPSMECAEAHLRDRRTVVVFCESLMAPMSRDTSRRLRTGVTSPSSDLPID